MCLESPGLLRRELRESGANPIEGHLVSSLPASIVFLVRGALLARLITVTHSQTDMLIARRPVAVLIVAGAYLAVGIGGFVTHFRDLLATPSEGVWIELTELVAVVVGVFLLRGRNWARWLAVAWIGFHVVLSVFVNIRQVAVHAVLAALIVWLLFRQGTASWFQPPSAEPVSARR